MLRAAPPRFTTKFRSETARLGEESSLKCEAIGDNPMEIKWHIDKQPLNTADDSRYEITEEISESKLTSTIKIESAKRRDSALFTCLVTNAFGQDETNIRLIVQEPPESPKEVKVIDQRSRTAKLSWSQPFNGNTPIIKFWITCHPKDFQSK